MITICVEKAHGDYDPGTSKFFGAPTCPEEWLEDGTVGDNDFFFCQLKIDEFKKKDSSDLLPKSGFLYFFLREENGTYVPNIRYCAEQPDALIDDFNAGFDFIENPEDEYSIDFPENGNCDGSLLLAENGDTVTLLKYDPLDDNMPLFLQETEKIAFFNIKKEDLQNLDFSKVSFTLE